MPSCLNCGSMVTPDYVRVFAGPDNERRGAVRCCPHCPDLVRHGNEIRDARSHRRGGQPGRTTGNAVKRGDSA